MEIRYVNVKKRHEYGKQCIFDDSEANVEENIFPNSKMMEDYINQNPVDRNAQMSQQYAVHEVQTVSTMTKESGMHHTEGGWPKEINCKDEEAVARYQRRIERDESWAPKMRQLMEPMERYILQNNAINIYEHYFDDKVPSDLVRPLGLRTIKVYRDPQQNTRPITHLSWSPDHGRRLAASYCSLGTQNPSHDLNLDSYIWDIENPNKALMSLKAAYPSVTIEFNPRDPSMLVSGLMSGQVCNWDTRSGNTPILVSHPQLGHKSPANCALWINSKTNSEFFSASTEGTINWWDIRMLQKPVESLIMDLEDPLRGDVVRATGVSALQYEPTMGTKFMAGLENGMLVNGTRKGKNEADKIATRFDCHYGPVVAINRNPFSIKNFLTVGDWTTKIWAEDTREGNLISTNQHKSILTGGCWSTSRYSVFYVINNEGMMEVFDILVGLTAPVTSARLGEDSLGAVAPHEEGKLVAVGSDRGKIHLIESSEALTSNNQNDKALMSAYFERCSRYEKAVDNRLKETRLAQRVIYQDSESTIPSPKVRVKGKGSPQKPASDKDKKVLEEKKKVEKERKKLRSKKTKDIWELLGDPELADVERQYFETMEKEMEKYADAALGVKELSKEIASTPSVRDVAANKRAKHEDPRDKEVASNKGDSIKKQRTPKGQSARDKGGKTTKTPEIVIVRRKRDTTPERSEARQFAGVELDINEDEVARSEKLGDTMAVDGVEEAGKKNIAPRKKSPGMGRMFSSRWRQAAHHEEEPCGDKVCHPEICCRDEIDSSSVADSGKESDGLPCEIEERKMNALIDEMLVGLPKDQLSHLTNLPHYTKKEKRAILKKDHAPPSILHEALRQARKDIRNARTEVMMSKKFDDSESLKVIPQVLNEDVNKSGMTETSSIISTGGIESSALGTRVESNESPRIPAKNACDPIVTRFDSQEILRVIGVDVTLPPRKPKKTSKSSATEITPEGATKYPRISAVNFDAIKRD